MLSLSALIPQKLKTNGEVIWRLARSISKRVKNKKISTLEKGNKHLKKYVAEHTKLLGVSPEKEGDLHRPISIEELEKSFCKELPFKELLVRDQRWKITNRKEALVLRKVI